MWTRENLCRVSLSSPNAHPCPPPTVTVPQLGVTALSCPVEFRARQTPAGPGSSSLCPPPDSSGPPAAFSSEPSPGTNPSAPVGAQPAGEATERPQRSPPRGCWLCSQPFRVHRLLCFLSRQRLCLTLNWESFSARTALRFPGKGGLRACQPCHRTPCWWVEGPLCTPFAA